MVVKGQPPNLVVVVLVVVSHMAVTVLKQVSIVVVEASQLCQLMSSQALCAPFLSCSATTGVKEAKSEFHQGKGALNKKPLATSSLAVATETPPQAPAVLSKWAKKKQKEKPLEISSKVPVRRLRVVVEPKKNHARGEMCFHPPVVVQHDYSGLS